MPTQKLLFYITISSLTLVLVYLPGLTGGFVFDDTSNILSPVGVRMRDLSWDSIKNAALSMENRPIARASFGLNYLASGFDPFYFKAVNIVIHGINTILVFGLVLFLLKQQIIVSKTSKYASRAIIIAAAVSLGWSLHPVNVTNVLYIVQRMNSLSALFVLAGMVCYVSGRSYLNHSPYKSWILIYASILVFLPLAWFSKENGALLPLFLLTIELTILRFHTQKRSQKLGLFLFHTVFVLLPLIFALVYIFQHTDQLLAGYDNRHFNLVERILTEPRVLWLYIRMILLPTPSLFGLFQDDIPISVSFTEPFVTAVAISGLIGLLVIGLASIKRAPVLAFGLLFFFTGHLMESSFLPLELAFEHRNYLPSIGLLLPLFYYLGYGVAPEKYMKVRFSIMAILILLFAFQTHLRARTWSDNARLYLTEVQFHPKSPRANYEAGKVFGQRLEQGIGDPETNYRAALEHFNRVTSLRKNTTSGLFGSILASIDSKQAIQAKWIDELEYRLGSKPLEQVNLLWLDKLTDCVSQGECHKEDIQIPRLINSAISNQYANRTNKAMLHAILARYSFQVEGDKDKTIAMARKAVSIIPSNMYYHLNLAKYLIWAGNKIEAKKVLNTAVKIDIYNQHATEIAGLMKILEKNNSNK